MTTTGWAAVGGRHLRIPSARRDSPEPGASLLSDRDPPPGTRVGQGKGPLSGRCQSKASNPRHHPSGSEDLQRGAGEGGERGPGPAPHGAPDPRGSTPPAGLGALAPRPRPRAILERGGARSGPPRPWLPGLLTRAARGQAPRHLRDPRRGQEKQQRASRGGPDARHVRAGRVRSRGMLGPSLAAAAAGTKPRPPAPWTSADWLRRPEAPPRPLRVSKTSRGAAARPGPWLFVMGQLCVAFGLGLPGSSLQTGSQRLETPLGRLCRMPG